MIVINLALRSPFVSSFCHHSRSCRQESVLVHEVIFSTVDKPKLLSQVFLWSWLFDKVIILYYWSIHTFFLPNHKYNRTIRLCIFWLFFLYLWGSWICCDNGDHYLMNILSTGQCLFLKFDIFIYFLILTLYHAFTISLCQMWFWI